MCRAAQLGGLHGDHRQTAACRGRTVGDSVDQWSTRIVTQLETLNHAPRAQQRRRRRTRIRAWVEGCLLDVFGGTVREHKFVGAPHAPVPRPVPFPGRLHGECAFHQFPNLPPQPVRLSAVPRACSTPLLSPSSHCAFLPVRPATRLLWPPPRSVWDARVSQWKVRGRGQKVGERSRAGHGLGPSRRVFLEMMGHRSCQS